MVQCESSPFRLINPSNHLANDIANFKDHFNTSDSAIFLSIPITLS